MARKSPSQPSGFVQGIKKFFLSAFVVFTFILYVLHERHPATAAASSGQPSQIPGQTVDTPAATQVPVTGSSTIAPAPQGATTYRNGTYTGPVVDVFYGNVQVQVTVQKGQITNVQFLQFPNDRRTSQEINAQAMPWLTQEAIQAQSANVDIISGATLTSEGFATSLQAALQSAKN